MKNYIKEYFTNTSNVMEGDIFCVEYMKEVSVDEFFDMNELEQEKSSILFKHIKCKDGFSMSVQASYGHYCQPRVTIYSKRTLFYQSMEVGYPNQKEELLREYCSRDFDKNATDTVYGEVPTEVLNKIIERHGGLL